METLVAALAGIVMVLVSVVLHYELLSYTARLLGHVRFNNRLRVTLGVVGVLVAHSVSIVLFALLYFFINESPWLGSLSGTFDGSPRDYLYFSLMSFTTLGVGDVIATGDMRLIAGLQALLGFVLIGWSASFTFVVMQRTWEEAD
ncbi:ion channel [Pelagibacterium xiamenense]|uniref:ion channel n=1 Tax=Pelagibacterium xiamenense TaxID=2901140 RepID=UPI001E2B1FBC|nr:ion channel [Pelagibacterium xiamenense]MCD7058845.1 potassium channel family protein [Pelagibacterium xiamenense]